MNYRFFAELNDKEFAVCNGNPESIVSFDETVWVPLFYRKRLIGNCVFCLWAAIILFLATCLMIVLEIRLSAGPYDVVHVILVAMALLFIAFCVKRKTTAKAELYFWEKAMLLYRPEWYRGQHKWFICYELYVYDATFSCRYMTRPHRLILSGKRKTILFSAEKDSDPAEASLITQYSDLPCRISFSDKGEVLNEIEKRFVKI